MNATNKQIMTALVYIKNNPDCTTRGTDLDENIVHYLYENGMVDGNETSSSSSDKGSKHEYSYLTITTLGEEHIETFKKQNLPTAIFNNKTVRYMIAALFGTLLATASAIYVVKYEKNLSINTKQPNKESPLIK